MRPARLPRDCPQCENRGFIDLDDSRAFPCPTCAAWCAICTAPVLPGRPFSWPQGCLVAGALRTPNGLVLFEGCACDYHKASALWSYSHIVPRMIGRFHLGQAYLWDDSVQLYGYGEAINWQELREEARQARAGGGIQSYGFGICDCPTDLAARAFGSSAAEWLGAVH